MFHDAKTPKKVKSSRAKSVRAKTSSIARPLKPRKRTSHKRVMHHSSWIFKLFMAGIIVIVMILSMKYMIEPLIWPNPLLGKWRTQTALGIMEIEFERNSMSSFGSKNPVSYDVEENKVIVFDDTIKVGNTYKIIDINTISTEVGGYKTVYKRVK